MRMNVEEAAKFTGLAKSTIRAYVCSRAIPFIKIGARVVFDSDDLENWLNSKKREVIK